MLVWSQTAVSTAIEGGEIWITAGQSIGHQLDPIVSVDFNKSAGWVACKALKVSAELPESQWVLQNSFQN